MTPKQAADEYARLRDLQKYGTFPRAALKHERAYEAHASVPEYAEYIKHLFAPDPDEFAWFKRA